MKKKVIALFVMFLFAWSYNSFCTPPWTCTYPGEYLPDDWSCFTYYKCDEGLIPVELECEGYQIIEERWGVAVVPNCWDQVNVQCTSDRTRCYCGPNLY